jgi:hypothetical protein
LNYSGEAVPKLQLLEDKRSLSSCLEFQEPLKIGFRGFPLENVCLFAAYKPERVSTIRASRCSKKYLLLKP